VFPCVKPSCFRHAMVKRRRLRGLGEGEIATAKAVAVALSKEEKAKSWRLPRMKVPPNSVEKKEQLRKERKKGSEAEKFVEGRPILSAKVYLL